jgi:hypothetical protein
VHERFCGICGQENLQSQETIAHLIIHFFKDITHFDGKFFSSLKYLIFRPGFLTSEYAAGRRSSYLNPIRMYIFTSFVYFFVFFSVNSAENLNKSITSAPAYDPKIRDSVFKAFNDIKALDSAELKEAKLNYDRVIGKARRDSFHAEVIKKAAHKKDSLAKLSAVDKEDLEIDVKDNFTFENRTYRDIKEYDSLIKAGKVDDNFIERIIERKELELNARYGKDNKRIQETLFSNFLHSIPQMFFLSLPLLALVLRLLYIRRKRFYYVTHVIFSLHLYVFTYITGLVIIGVNAIEKSLDWHWMTHLEEILVTLIFVYGYLALKNFYGQGIFKTFLKFILILLSLFIIAIISMVIIGLIALYKS